MKTYAECKTAIARQYGYLTWPGFMEGESLFNCDTTQKHKRYALMNEEVAKLYAQQVAEDVRQRCMLNADVHHVGSDVYLVDADSILITEIILP